MNPLSPYIRVSRVSGRGGDAYGSPDEQERAIRAWAASQNVELEAPVVDEDVSGATRAEERGLGALLARVERGESSGVVCYRLSRFGRSLADVLTNVDRLKAAGGRLVCTADGIDSSNASGKLLIGVLGTLAEIERDTRAEYWDASVRRAIERGQHVGGRVPIGYDRSVDGRLAPNALAPVVRKAFALRARGGSWADVARLLTEGGVKVGTSGAQSVIRSRTYCGEVFSGKHRTPDAHEALVSEAEWQAAQRRGESPTHDGSIAAQGLLAGGLAVCAGCDRAMGVNSNGRGTVSYICRPSGRVEKCPAPASITVAQVDPAVEALLREHMARDVDAKAAQADDERTRRAVEEAVAELEAFVEHASAAALGELYRRELEKRRDAVNAADAERRRYTAREVSGLVAPAGPWDDLPMSTRRKLARGFVERVTIRKAGGRRQPIEERLEVVWR